MILLFPSGTEEMEKPVLLNWACKPEEEKQNLEVITLSTADS
jgi:hypothetical protein